MSDFHPETHEAAVAVSDHAAAVTAEHGDRPSWLTDALCHQCPTYKDIVTAGPQSQATTNQAEFVRSNANVGTAAGTAALDALQKRRTQATVDKILGDAQTAGAKAWTERHAHDEHPELNQLGW